MSAEEDLRVLLDNACGALAAAAVLHLMTRTDNDRCGICNERWPCKTYQICTRDLNTKEFQ